MNPDTHDYYSFLDFRPISFQLACGTSVIREIEGSVRKDPVVENSVLCLFFK